jgi:hypothetical protein
MMGPASHFLFGALCGSAVGALIVVARRRWLPLLPPFVLLCGLWAELPLLLGFRDVTHWSANVFFGYVWLHSGVWSNEGWAFTLVVGLGGLMCAAYAVSLTWYFWTVDMVRWERGMSRSRRSARGKRGP